MSISRKNWSALSSLARQWTMEDEEEIEREKRRRGKTGGTAEADADSSSTPRSSPSGDDNSGTESSSEMSQGLSSLEQMQLDFVEMLRVRDEKRKMRLVETLRQQKEDEENGGEGKSGPGEGDARVVLLGELDEEKDTVSKPKPPPKKSSYCPTTSSINNSKTRTNKHEDGASSRRDPVPDPQPASAPPRKFVSSLSISLDHPPSPSASGPASPIPCSPASPLSPRDHRPSSCQSPSHRGANSPVQNGHTRETSLNGPSTNGKFEQTSKPAFIRQSSRTLSFRMMKKKEDESAPLQRSSSVRIASKKFESTTDQNEDEDKSFQRNSRQRISSRSIKEKMEKLAQAAQKSEQTRSPDVTQRTLFLLEEVSRKRGIFEKEQPAQSLSSPGVSRQEFRSFASGMSDRINRWLNKTNQPGMSPTPDLRHVDITSKRSLFENSEEESVARVDPGNNK